MLHGPSAIPQQPRATDNETLGADELGFALFYKHKYSDWNPLDPRISLAIQIFSLVTYLLFLGHFYFCTRNQALGCIKFTLIIYNVPLVMRIGVTVIVMEEMYGREHPERYRNTALYFGQALIFRVCLVFIMHTLFRMKKIELQLNASQEEQSFHEFVRQLRQFIRLARIFLFVILMDFLYNIFFIILRMHDTEGMENNSTLHNCAVVFGVMNLCWFTFYCFLACYFLNLSEKYYKILLYDAKMTQIQRCLYIGMAITFVIGCINFYVLNAVILMMKMETLKAAEYYGLFHGIQVTTMIVVEFLPLFFGLTIVRIVYQVNQMGTPSGDVESEDEGESLESLMHSFQDMFNKTLSPMSPIASRPFS